MPPMRELWRKAFELFRRHPILWVPYAGALLATDCFSWLRDVERTAIFRQLSAPHHQRSALGGSFSVPGFDAATMRTFEQIQSCVTWATHFVNIYIDAAAMVVTAIVVGMILQQRRISFPTAFTKLRGYSGRILLYSAKYWLLMLVFFVPSYLIDERILFGAKPSPSMRSMLIFGVSLLTEFSFAWIMAPVALELLKPMGSPRSTGGLRRIARYSFIVVVAGIMILGRVLNPLFEILSHGSIAGEFGARYLAPLFIEFPYILLFIALALIATEDPFTSVAEAPLHLPQSLKNLMPLHYPPENETE